MTLQRDALTGGTGGAVSTHVRGRLNHSLVQVADDIFEDLVVVLREAAQDVLHRLEALFPIVDL